MNKYGLTLGNPELLSIGALAFGPDGILFVADSRAATVFAIDVGEQAGPRSGDPVDVSGLDGKLAALLGVNRADVFIHGMAVHPESQSVYLSVTRGRGNAAVPVLVRITPDGELSDVPLTAVPFAQTAITDAPAEDDERGDISLDRSAEDAVEREYNGVTFSMATISLRTSTITDLAWIDGTLLVAGASNEEFSSTLRRIPFPFTGDSESNSLEIYHVSHGKYETASPIRTFVPFDGNTSVLASYTCTPVVQFSLTDLQAGALAKGRTVAELGPINQPLDMISYASAGEEFLLVSNTRHALLKIPAAAISDQPALHEPNEPTGVPREQLGHEGVTYLANLGGSHVVMLQREGDAVNLHSYPTASL